MHRHQLLLSAPVCGSDMHSFRGRGHHNCQVLSNTLDCSLINDDSRYLGRLMPTQFEVGAQRYWNNLLHCTDTMSRTDHRASEAGLHHLQRADKMTIED